MHARVWEGLYAVGLRGIRS